MSRVTMVNCILWLFGENAELGGVRRKHLLGSRKLFPIWTNGLLKINALLNIDWPNTVHTS